MNALSTTFNTGLGYSAAGQIVHLKFVALEEQSDNAKEFGDVDGTLYFYDETRGLWGKWNTCLLLDSQPAKEEDLQSLFSTLTKHNVSCHDITFAEAEALKPNS